MSEETTIEEIPMFLFTCADGAMFEIPSNTPGLTAGGFQVDDDTAATYDYVCMDPSKMPVHFQQFYLAGSRNTMPELPPTSEVIGKKRSGKKAKKTLKRIDKILNGLDDGLISGNKALDLIVVQVERYFI